jgi:hypothetical protein
MPERNRQFDDLERQASGRLRADLQTLYEPPGGIPPQVDNAVRDQIQRRFARPRRIIPLRWAGGLAAAAAVIAFALILYDGRAPTNWQSTNRNPHSITSRQSVAEGRADVDRSGRVDILDAFRLAKHIESGGPTDIRWDLNEDGRVDRDDVDLVAFAAVRLGKGV